eukprot:351269-Chlamydomonas_euryale.AAC.9
MAAYIPHLHPCHTCIHASRACKRMPLIAACMPQLHAGACASRRHACRICMHATPSTCIHATNFKRMRLIASYMPQLHTWPHGDVPVQFCTQARLHARSACFPPSHKCGANTTLCNEHQACCSSTWIGCMPPNEQWHMNRLHALT